MKTKSFHIYDRDCDLIDTINHLAKKNRGYPISFIIQISVDSPARRFYITAKHVKRFLTNRISGKCELKGDTRQEMYDEIESRLNGDYSIRNIEKIIAQPAPKFYIKPRCAYIYYCNYLKNELHRGK